MTLPGSERPGPLRLLSILIPTRNEESAIASTVEHLFVELRLHEIPHEIVVIDDGSTDSTWDALCKLQPRVPTLNPVRNGGENGYGRAVSFGFDYARPVRGPSSSRMRLSGRNDNRQKVAP